MLLFYSTLKAIGDFCDAPTFVKLSKVLPLKSNKVAYPYEAVFVFTHNSSLRAVEEEQPKLRLLCECDDPIAVNIEDLEHVAFRKVTICGVTSHIFVLLRYLRYELCDLTIQLLPADFINFPPAHHREAVHFPVLHTLIFKEDSFSTRIDNPSTIFTWLFPHCLQTLEISYSMHHSVISQHPFLLQAQNIRMYNVPLADLASEVYFSNFQKVHIVWTPDFLKTLDVEGPVQLPPSMKLSLSIVLPYGPRKASEIACKVMDVLNFYSRTGKPFKLIFPYGCPASPKSLLSFVDELGIDVEIGDPFSQNWARTVSHSRICCANLAFLVRQWLENSFRAKKLHFSCHSSTSAIQDVVACRESASILVRTKRLGNLPIFLCQNYRTVVLSVPSELPLNYSSLSDNDNQNFHFTILLGLSKTLAKLVPTPGATQKFRDAVDMRRKSDISVLIFDNNTIEILPQHKSREFPGRKSLSRVSDLEPTNCVNKLLRWVIELLLTEKKATVGPQEYTLIGCKRQQNWTENISCSNLEGQMLFQHQNGVKSCVVLMPQQSQIVQSSVWKS